MPEMPRIRSEVGMSPIAWIAGSKAEMGRLPPRTTSSGFGGKYPDFCDLIFGRAQGRTSDTQITFYHNMGNQGLQFASVGGLVYRKVRESGKAFSIDTSLFLQDIRD